MTENSKAFPIHGDCVKTNCWIGEFEAGRASGGYNAVKVIDGDLLIINDKDMVIH